MGETTFRLTDIKRNEPDASLFQAPAGTKINVEPIIELHRENGSSEGVASSLLLWLVKGRAETPGFFMALLSFVVGLRLGVNEHLEQLRRGLLETDFQLGRNVMHAGERQIVGHGAVA